MIPGEVIRAFRKSALRLKVLKYINSQYPNTTYLSQIAYAINADILNVLGCVRGFSGRKEKYPRYRNDMSLMGLGLVEPVEKGDHTYYRIKDKEMADEIILMFPMKYMAVEI